MALRKESAISATSAVRKAILDSMRQFDYYMQKRFTGKGQVVNEENRQDPAEQLEPYSGWESDIQKLQRNLTWPKEKILDWLEEANQFSRETKVVKDVLRRDR